jgi:hypothetical protein
MRPKTKTYCAITSICGRPGKGPSPDLCEDACPAGCQADWDLPTEASLYSDESNIGVDGGLGSL